MKFFSIKTLASRGWLTIFISLFGLLLSMMLMKYGVIFGKYLMQAGVAFLPIGIYDIFRGRGKYKDISLDEYKAQAAQNKEYRIHIGLAFVGAYLSGYIGGQLGI